MYNLYHDRLLRGIENARPRGAVCQSAGALQKGAIGVNYNLEVELIRLELRGKQETKPLAIDTSLGVAVRKLPGAWTRAMCEALSLPVSNRDVERKAAITQHLLAPRSIEEVWHSLPDPSRRIIFWLVGEQGGFAKLSDLYDEFGIDDDYAYFWNKGERPTTALGLLRLYGLVYKGWIAADRGRVKVAVVPVELREPLEAMAREAETVQPAPPMPKPAFRKKSPRQEVLEVRSLRGAMKRRGFYDVYQFMIVLKDISPPIWRRIQIPESYSFWDLHVAIQDAMGWLDYHLHEFSIPEAAGGPAILLGFSDEEFAEKKVLPDHTQYISDYFSAENPLAHYLYDFGDGWEHEVRFEAVLPVKEGVSYPVCVDGERACPPEDCGGLPGFEDFLRIIGDPTDEEHQEMTTWVGGSYDPERFEASAVRFDDPLVRWRVAYLHDEEAYESLMLARKADDSAVPVTHTNRQGDLYYLHSGLSKTGKPTYHFSKKAKGNLAYEIPEGFEVYENPDGRVFLRRTQKKVISDEEKRIVESAVEKAGVTDSIVEVKKDVITVFLGDLEENDFSNILDIDCFLADLIEKAESVGVSIPDDFRKLVPEIVEKARAARPKPAELLKKVQTYSPVLRFTLHDKVERTFEVERAFFTAGTDEWLWLAGSAGLRELAKKYCRHIGKDSFDDLW